MFRTMRSLMSRVGRAEHRTESISLERGGWVELKAVIKNDSCVTTEVNMSLWHEVKAQVTDWRFVFSLVAAVAAFCNAGVSS